VIRPIDAPEPPLDINGAEIREAPDDDPGPSGEEGPRSRQEFVQAQHQGGRRRRSTRARWVRRGIAIVVVILLVPVAWSYAHALQRPGSDSNGIRTVEWIRDHGGNGIVNTIERWWYTNNPPPVGGKPHAIHVKGSAADAGAEAGAVPALTPELPEHLQPPTQRVPTPAPTVEQNEGVWLPVGRPSGGVVGEYIAFVRPDAVHTSYFTALMWLDTKLLKAVYVPGLQEPGGGPNFWNSEIPVDQRPAAIAAFNSGFKMDSARGGVYFDGQMVRPLVDGAASLVIKADGSASVGVWGRDFTMTPDIASVRQNLELIVDNGQLNPALRDNDTSVFGATVGNDVYVWRSGVGVDANGGLIYAGGPALSVTSLARTLQNAGAVRAMELDINSDWVSAYTYVNSDPNNPNSPVVGIKLGGDMSRDGNRYLEPGERDFFAFFADPKVATPVPTTPTTTAPARRKR
jgi:hypothetical protein